MSPAGGGALRTTALVALAVVAIALAARVDVAIPGTPVPQSLQTLAVVIVGGWLGCRLGATALTAYLLAGAVGLPVFAGGAGGPGVLVGPTAGYLFGFVVAATLVGLARDRGRLERLGPAIAVMVVAHLLILSVGWLRLAFELGAQPAWAGGVVPFIVGGVVKSIVGAALVVFVPFGARSTDSLPSSTAF